YARFDSAFDGAGRTRVCHNGTRGLRHGHRFRQSCSAIGFLAVLAALPLLSGCPSTTSPTASPDPEPTFEAVRAELVHGNLESAQRKAETARHDFADSGADWPLKFRL